MSIYVIPYTLCYYYLSSKELRSATPRRRIASTMLSNCFQSAPSHSGR